MSFISEVSESVAPINDVGLQRHEILSPDQSWLAVFHDPYEWHMGADGWQFFISSSNGKSLKFNSKFDSLSNGKGLIYPLDYSPWSSDSKMLALCFWESGLVFFQPSSNTFRVINLYPHIVQWSPTVNYLLAFSNNQFAVLDPNGDTLHTIAWQTAAHELPRVGWLKSGVVFYVVGRTSKQAKTRITFLNAESGTIISTEFLDPAKLVPYNSKEYTTVPRGKYSLVLSPSTRSVGTLLDTWSDVLPNQEKDSILLSVYRPTSNVYDLDGCPVCKVEKKWVSIKMHG